MVLKINRGYSPDYLLKEVATGRENYYSGAVAEGEPPGRWWGSGADLLGLTGLVDAQDMRGVYERFLDPREEGFNNPAAWDEVYTLGQPGRRYLSEDELYEAAVGRELNATPERRAELRLEAGRNARHNVAFFDLTYNVQKSISLLHTAFEAQQVAADQAGDVERAQAWGQMRQAVEDAIWAGNNAMLTFVNEQAGYSRIGHHGGGAGRWIDARDWVVASFFQHDSREHDPHLHIHNAFLNRVLGADGVWRTVDGQLLYRWERAAAAIAERITAERLTHGLGVVLATRPDGKAREIVGVAQEAMDLLSTRRRQLTAKTTELAEAFEQRRGRAPNSLELDRLAQQATLMTRRAKSHTGESREQVLDRVDATLRTDLDGGLAAIAHAVLAARPQEIQTQTWSPQTVIELALEDVRRTKAGWTEADLTAAIEAALPDTIGITDGADLTLLLHTLTRQALGSATALSAHRPGDALLPVEQQLANGRSSFESPGSTLYSTPDQVHTERALIAATTAGGATALPDVVARRFIEQLRASGVELGVDQAAAVVGILTSGARVECLVGPAGTGKSFVVGALARAWTDPNHLPIVDPDNPSPSAPLQGPRRVFGLATSQIATNILAAEGLTARNVSRWVSTQDRLAARPGAGGPQVSAEEQLWRLHAGDLVVVDESAMTDTAVLAAIHRYAEAAGAKLLLVGDHRQLAAVGAGGAMDLMAQAGARYELTEARRFTHDWERDASLRLRDGDRSVLDTYHRQGRLLDSGTRDQAEASAARAWLADTLAGRNAVLLVDDNPTAARLSAQLRGELVRLGRVTEHGVPLAQGTVAGVGDLVQARSNGWALAGFEGNRRGPINREAYQVTAVRDDGTLEVRAATPDGDLLVLPAAYVAEHLALAYASTVHAAQGRTTDTSHAVITAQTSMAALYVALSRGRDANTAHIATTTTIDDPAQGSGREHVLHRNPLSVLAAILDADERPADRSATALAADSVAFSASVQTAGEMLAAAAADVVTARTAEWLDHLVHDGHLTPDQRTRLAAEDGAASLGRLLRRAELAALDARQVLTDAITVRPLDGAHNTTNVLVSRITDGGTRRFNPIGDHWVDWVPATGRADWDAWLTELAIAADHRTAELGRQTADAAPAWAVEALGPVPAADDPDRSRWEQRAGLVAGYRELRGHTDGVEALDRPPSPNRQAEAYAAYRAAWEALGRPQVEQAEHEMGNGAHRQRIRAWQREQAIAPRYVGNELAGTRQAAAYHRQAATLRAAEATQASDAAEQTRLRQEAADARALATTLDQRVGELEELDRAYHRHRLHSTVTRVNHDVSAHILADRGVLDDEPEQQITAEEWLATHRGTSDEDERHRPITEDDLADDHELRSGRAATQAEDTIEPDLREIASAEPRHTHEDDTRVPDTQEMVGSIRFARRTLHELDARDVYDQQADEEERAAELSRWHDDDAQNTTDMDELGAERH